MNWDRLLATAIDHTVLKADATESDVRAACADSQKYGFASLVVSPYYLPLAVSLLENSPVRSCTVVSFPLGAQEPSAKVDDTTRLLDAGAREIDVVMNIGAFLSGEHQVLVDEIAGIAEVCTERAVFKLIIETAYLSKVQITQATNAAVANGANFVKTSTGYAKRGVTLDDIRIIKSAAHSRIGIKASGGIRTAEFAHALLEAGATRLGCSESVEVVQQVR
ncbi:MAG: deoxyribose-phosphate aldolase [Candidatus Krumholzibacteria bacterium]|nr:deoxyribose-phosphate aldolase [Candidatus Krumholzibacteria bacterium]